MGYIVSISVYMSSNSIHPEVKVMAICWHDDNRSFHTTIFCLPIRCEKTNFQVDMLSQSKVSIARSLTYSLHTTSSQLLTFACKRSL